MLLRFLFLRSQRADCPLIDFFGVCCAEDRATTRLETNADNNIVKMTARLLDFITDLPSGWLVLGRTE